MKKLYFIWSMVFLSIAVAALSATLMLGVFVGSLTIINPINYTGAYFAVLIPLVIAVVFFFLSKAQKQA